MDEHDLIRRTSSDVPELDPEAKERARAMLRAEMGSDLASATGRHPLRPRLAWLAAAASIGVVLLLLQVLAPSRHTAPAASTAGDLKRLASLASSQAALDVSGDRYLYTQMESLHGASYSVGTDLTIGLSIAETIETWRRQDGSGSRETAIQVVHFSSQADRFAWETAGRPIDLPKAGDIEVTRFQPGDFFADLSGLPTDPVELKAVLETGQLLDQSPGDANLAIAIGEVFEQGGIPPEISAALFEILDGLPSVRVLDPMIDPLARPGIGITVREGNGGERWFVFDADTASFLAAETVRPGDTEPSSWEALTATAVVDGDKERPNAA